ncbi:MAG: alpha/beta hydrolase [Anaerolineales bacterium]|nr:alpha/beta hydrolase [Anaerolineales bacterium]MCX7754079.1 alpha/beta hydrolase [Anaerolineales bacterium]MDW8278838.1 alpha/beta fold hydrolase [Anaerolineales bacterium]
MDDAAIAMHEFQLTLEDCVLNLAEGPNNGPLLLLLHGFTNRWQVFQPILPVVLPKWHVVTFDFRGHGRSGRARRYSAAGFYQDAVAVLGHFAPEPVVLLGHSMGGSIALHLAQNFPERVRAVVTGDTSLDLAMHVETMNQRRNVKLFGLRRKLAGRPVEELLRRGLPSLQAHELAQLDPHVMDYHAEGRVGEFFADVQDVDFDRIRCPVLLTQASPQRGGLLQDAEIPPVLAAHPHFRFHRFESGHDLDIEQGLDSPFWQVSLAFLEPFSLYAED